MSRTPLASTLQEIALSRRQFLGAAGAAAVTAATWAPRARAAAIGVTVHEANDPVGGRCWSLRGAFAPGQVVEGGGELIDTKHVEIRQLCHELGLSLDNLLQGETNGTEPLYFFDGRPYQFSGRATVDGACHVAGEHTTQDYQGYLQGAVFSGQRAAPEVIDAIG